MNNKVELKEIVYCDLTILHNKKKHILRKVVYKNIGGTYYHMQILNEIKIKEQVKVIDVKIIARLGFESKLKNIKNE